MYLSSVDVTTLKCMFPFVVRCTNSLQDSWSLVESILIIQAAIIGSHLAVSLSVSPLIMNIIKKFDINF